MIMVIAGLIVLILVLVDVGLGPRGTLRGGILHRVLILVLVDVGLGHTSCRLLKENIPS